VRLGFTLLLHLFGAGVPGMPTRRPATYLAARHRRRAYRDRTGGRRTPARTVAHETIDLSCRVAGGAANPDARRDNLKSAVPKA
jgi:hypothetical protein